MQNLHEASCFLGTQHLDVLVRDGWCAYRLRDVAGHEVEPFGFGECVTDQAVHVADAHRRQPGRLRRRDQAPDVEGSELVELDSAPQPTKGARLLIVL